MGFYGNISNSNKSSFTFDKVYSTRKEMDAACDTDGIFLGRFVLVEYDISPIKGYYQDSAFYTDKQCKNLMIAVEGNYYQNLFETENNIYHYQSGVFTKITAENYDYGAHYKIDVETYGRGYDSTAWMKRYDAENHNFKYVMIAELNTVIPDFHLIVDPPVSHLVEGKPIFNTPYFDKFSTNVNYYLHIPGPYDHTFSFDYNEAGFSDETRSFADAAIVGPLDSVTYDYTTGTRTYLDNIYDEEESPKIDTYAWKVNLRSIGNMACKFWDLVYGTDRKRSLSTSMEEQDDVTREPETIMGLFNCIRDLLGYAIAEVTDQTPTIIEEQDFKLYYKESQGAREYYSYLKVSDKEYKLTLLHRKPEDDEEFYENSLYGLLTLLHSLLGDPDSNNTDTIYGCLNQASLYFSAVPSGFQEQSFVVINNEKKFTTFGAEDDDIAEENSEKLFIKDGSWVDLETMLVTDPYNINNQISVKEVLDKLKEAATSSVGNYKGLDILDDLINIEMDYVWEDDNGEISLNQPTQSESATVRDVNHSIYLVEKKMDVLYDMLLQDIVTHFNLEMKEPIFTIPFTMVEGGRGFKFEIQETEATGFYNEYSCIITGIDTAGKTQSITMLLSNNTFDVELTDFNFTSFEKVVLKRTHPLRSQSTELVPITSEIVLFERKEG